jgi:hypothetical protein
VVRFATQRFSKRIALLAMIWIVLSLLTFPLATFDEFSPVSRDLVCEAAEPDDSESTLDHKGMGSNPGFVTASLSEMSFILRNHPGLSLCVVVSCSKLLSLRC